MNRETALLRAWRAGYRHAVEGVFCHPTLADHYAWFSGATEDEVRLQYQVGFEAGKVFGFKPRKREAQ